MSGQSSAGKVRPSHGHGGVENEHALTRGAGEGPAVDLRKAGDGTRVERRCCTGRRARGHRVPKLFDDDQRLAVAEPYPYP